jgi:CrcB protein
VKILYIGVLGLTGVYLRHFISTYYSHGVAEFPVGTFLANSIGCFIAGVVFAFIGHYGHTALLTGLLTGLCGGLTTFSSYNLQFLVLLNQGLYFKGVSYFLLGPFIGIIMIIFGYFISQKLFHLQNIS